MLKISEIDTCQWIYNYNKFYFSIDIIITK